MISPSLSPTRLIFIPMVLVLSGCLSFGLTKQSIEEYEEEITPAVDTGAIVDSPMEMIANDFVGAMRQLPTLYPSTTTIQLLRDQMGDDIIRAFKTKLDDAGYAVRWVAEPNANNLLQYRRENSNPDSVVDKFRLDIAVGDVELRRSYTGVQDKRVQPITPLYVRGADASGVVLDDSAFFPDAKQTSTELPSTEVALLTVPENITPLEGLVASASETTVLTTSALTSKAKNVFDLGESNYANELSEYSTLIRQILTFPNDSLRMGSINKQLLSALVSRYNPDTDLLSVLGCSFGTTKLKNGNAALALGRASRVREALLFSGVEPDNILDEGCWAGDSSSSMLPGRGVVVTLNRKSQ